jgi:hypothetical protein
MNYFKTTIKNIVLVSLLIILIGNFAIAQPGNHQGPPPVPTSDQVEKMVTELNSELSLSETQKTKMSGIFTAHFDEVRELSKSRTTSREVMEAKKAEFENSVKAILTEDQQKQFDTYQKEHQPQQGRPRK